MKFITILIMVISLSVISCENEINEKFCENEKSLLSPNNELKTLKTSLEKLNDSILIDNGLNLNCVSSKKQEFNILVNSLKIKTFIKRNCCLCIRSEVPAISILVNNGKVLITTSEKDTIIEIRKIPEWFEKHYLKIEKEKRLFEQIELGWNKDISKKSLYNVIQEIIKGYLISIDKISVKEYEKKICELELNELKRIMKILPFELKLTNFNENLIEIERKTNGN